MRFLAIVIVCLAAVPTWASDIAGWWHRPVPGRHNRRHSVTRYDVNQLPTISNDNRPIDVQKKSSQCNRRLKGPQGPPGPPGPPGNDGPPGPKGEAHYKPLDSRPSNTKGGLSSHSNWKECSWKNILDDKDNGLIKECIFEKKYSDTILHVYWNGNFRLRTCQICCKRWFFTFNGAECQTPNAIDGLVYMHTGGHDNDVHRVRHIEGHCTDSIDKGMVRVGFNVGNCEGFGDADAATGWNAVSRLFVEEVPSPQTEITQESMMGKL